MSDQSYVVLEDAFAWDCPQCHRRNYAEWVPLEIDSETIQELRDDGEPLGENVYDVRFPYQVRCRRCRCQFGVANYLFEDEQAEEREEGEED